MCIRDRVRSMPKKAMTKEDFPFYNTTMWDYEFQMRFAQWIHNKKDAVRTCCLIGDVYKRQTHTLVVMAVRAESELLKAAAIIPIVKSTNTDCPR